MAVNYVSQASTEVNGLFCDESLKKYVKEVMKYTELSAEEEQELAKRAQAGDEEAKKKLTEANLKLVVTIARKVIHSSKLPMTDLLQEGSIGLMAAIDKFNWKFGYRFSTYASWWIKQAMFKAISEQSHSVKIPVYIQETLSRYSKLKREMENKANKAMEPEEVAEKMNIEPYKIINYLGAYKKTLSLECDYEMSNGSEVNLADIIEDERSSFQNSIENDFLKKEVACLLSNLKDRERKVITLRFGLNGAQRQTLEEIGRIYGVTKECIRQTESRALGKLRTNKLSAGLYKDYLV